MSSRAHITGDNGGGGGHRAAGRTMDYINESDNYYYYLPLRFETMAGAEECERSGIEVATTNK